MTHVLCRNLNPTSLINYGNLIYASFTTNSPSPFSTLFPVILVLTKRRRGDFPGGAVVKNPPANTGDTGSSPGPGRSHMLQSNLSPCATTTEPAL